MTTLTLNAWLGLLITGAALLIGGVATYTQVRNSRGPRERRFVIARCAAAWAVIFLLLFLMVLTPFPWNALWLIPYFVHLPIAIYRFASKQQLIRILEAREAAPGREMPPGPERTGSKKTGCPGQASSSPPSGRARRPAEPIATKTGAT